MLAPFPHPATGEALETREQFLAAIAEIEEEMRPFWSRRRQLREAMAERFEAPALELRPRDRTERQEKVARCPRCGGVETKEET